jgi:hypothetical protein
MALPDPQTLTLNGAQTLPKIVDDGLKSVYISADGKLTLTISHQVNARRRTVVRLDETRVASDPITAVQKSIVGSTYIVGDFPLWGFTTAEKVAQLTSITSALAATTNALHTRILNGEH